MACQLASQAARQSSQPAVTCIGCYFMCCMCSLLSYWNQQIFISKCHYNSLLSFDIVEEKKQNWKSKSKKKLKPDTDTDPEEGERKKIALNYSRNTKQLLSIFIGGYFFFLYAHTCSCIFMQHIQNACKWNQARLCMQFECETETKLIRESLISVFKLALLLVRCQHFFFCCLSFFL